MQRSLQLHHKGAGAAAATVLPLAWVGTASHCTLSLAGQAGSKLGAVVSKTVMVWLQLAVLPEESCRHEQAKGAGPGRRWAAAHGGHARARRPSEAACSSALLGC